MTSVSIAGAMPQASRDGGPDVHGVPTRARWRRWAAAGTFLAAVLGTALYWLLATPLYRADTMVRLPSPVVAPARDTDAARSAAERAPAGRSAAAEAEILRSRDVLLPVIAQVGVDVVVDDVRRWGWVPAGSRHGVRSVELKLPARAHGQPFVLQVAQGQWTLADEQQRVVARGELGANRVFDIAGEPARIRVDGDATGPEVRLRVTQEAPLKAYEQVLRRLRVFETGVGTGILRAVYDDPVPSRAAALVNAMAAAYVELSTTRRLQDTEEAVRLAETQQLAPLGERLRAAEAALAAYRKKVLGVNDVGDTRSAERRRDDLQEQLSHLEARRAQLSRLYTPRHPDFVDVQEQIARVRAELARAVDPASLPEERQREHGRLLQELQSASRQYAGALDEVQQLRATAASQAAAARQLDVAAAPQEPAYPDAAVVWTTGLAIALALAVVVAGTSTSPSRVLTESELVELGRSLATPAPTPLDAGLRVAMEPTRARVRLSPRSPSAPLWRQPADPALPRAPAVNAPAPHGDGDEAADDKIDALAADDAASLPVPSAPPTAVAPTDPARDRLRPILRHLDASLGDDQGQILLLTSPSYEAGIALVASTLAALTVEGDRRVLLLEADLRRPQVQLYLGVEPKTPGLSDVLAGELELRDVVQPYRDTSIDFIARGKAEGDSAGLLFRPALAETLMQLRGLYDRVVVHAPPLMVAGDALAFAGIVDGALLVVPEDLAASPETREAKARLERAGIALAEVVPAVRLPRLGSSNG